MAADRLGCSSPSSLGEGDRPAQPGGGGASTLTATTLQLAGVASALLGWRPAEFWAATPAELATALSPFLPPDAAPDRATLSKLMKDHPDG